MPVVARRRLLAVAAALVLVVVLFDSILRLTGSGEIRPGVAVAGLDVGGLSSAQARERIAAEAVRPLRFGRTPVSAAAAGIAWDVEATLRRAKDAGRGGPLGFGSSLGSLFRDRTVQPVLRVDPARRRRLVAQLAERVDRPANNGGFRIDPSSLKALISSPKAGRRLDRKRLLERIERAAGTGERAIEVPIDRTPALPRAAVQRVARKAETYLRRPLTVRAGGRSVAVPAAALAGAITMTTRDGEPKLSLPRSRLGGVMQALRSKLDRQTRPPRFSRAGESVSLIEKGSVTWRPRKVDVSVEPGRAGRKLPERRTALAVGDAVRAGRHSLRASLGRDATSVSAEQARRVDSVIGTFTTPYEPGQPRVKNIQRIARAADGMVVAPGATFSLNALTGERTKDKGYVEAPFISDNKIVPSVGGGVSQFSTTLYNAAYFAGLPLDSSQPHSLYIDRYPPGREATLNFPSIDLRWTNDTAAPIVIQTASTDTSVTVRLLGDNGRRRVEAEPGEREAADGGDFSITVTRVIRYDDGRRVEQPRTTRYETPVEDG